MATRNGFSWNTMVDPKGRQLNLLMVVQMAGSFRMGIVAPILALLIRRHGVSIIEIGVLGVAGMLGWLIFEPLSGVISDRVNRRVMIAFSIVSTSIIYLLYPLQRCLATFSYSPSLYPRSHRHPVFPPGHYSLSCCPVLAVGTPMGGTWLLSAAVL